MFMDSRFRGNDKGENKNPGARGRDFSPPDEDETFEILHIRNKSVIPAKAGIQ